MGCDLNYKITDLRKVWIRLAREEARATGYQLLAFQANIECCERNQAIVMAKFANKNISLLCAHDTVIRTTDASNVSESTRTISPVSAKRGTAINRTSWPSGPSIEAVSNLGCEPAKNR
jgi:hypothetical protein